MRTRAVITLSVAVAVIVALVLLAVIYGQDFSERAIAASLLILSFVVFGVGGLLYTGRDIWKWPAGQTPGYLRWERGFVITAVLATVLGLVLLEDILHSAGDAGVARLGMVTYVFGAVVVVVAETSYLGNRAWVYPQIVLYVVLAFLAQAAFGVVAAPDRTAGGMGRLGDDHLEHSVAGCPAHPQPAQHLLSCAPPCSAAHDWDRAVGEGLSDLRSC